MLVATRTKPAGQPLGAAAAGAAPIFVETDGRGDEVRVVPDEASPVRPVRVTEDPLPIEWVVPRRGGARSPKDCDTYASVQSSYDDLASLASERCCDEDPRSPDAALDDAYRRYVAARDAPAPARTPTPEPKTFDASTTPPPGLRVHARRPAQAATPLDVFLRLRGLDAHADVLYGLGARKIGDLRYLRKEDYAGVGLDLGDLDMKVQF